MLMFISVLCVYAQDDKPVYDYTDKIHGGSENGIVGKIPDELSVSPFGQLSYEIPIAVTGGTGGVAPKLSVTYSGSSEIGLFGHGFDLSGLSIIQRVPANRFNDGFSGSVDVSTARFAMDGARLILLEKRSDGEYIYATENDNYSRIVAHGSETNPSSFDVNTKDGLLYHYEPSYALLNGTSSIPTLFWVVTKVSDTNGNYFIVKYDGDKEYNEIYPVEIDYTLNDKAGLEAYASIKIEYPRLGNNPKIKYVSGLPVKKRHIISKISLYSGDLLLQEYNFDYNGSFLNKITLKSGDGEAKNPTVIDWSTVNNYNFNKTQSQFKDVTSLTNQKLFTGDFNGDGISDILSVPVKQGDCKWELRTSTGNSMSKSCEGYFKKANGDVINGTIDDVAVGDYNGDGYMDFVVLLYYNTKYELYLYLNSSTDGGCVFPTGRLLDTMKSKPNIHVGEFNDDGVTDMVFTCENSCLYYLFLSNKSQTSIEALSTKNVRSVYPKKFDVVKTIDFNGDGLTDFLNLTDDGYSVFVSNKDGELKEACSRLSFSKKDYVYCGDLNGDGKTDVLVAGEIPVENKQTRKDWWAFVSNGIDNYKSVSQRPLVNLFDAEEIELFLLDVNADGIDDIIGIDRKMNSEINPGGMIAPRIYLNNGWCDFSWINRDVTSLSGSSGRRSGSRDGGAGSRGGGVVSYNNGYTYPLDVYNYYFGDFNGDGKHDFICTSNWDYSGFKSHIGHVYLMPNTPNNLISKITDGMGHSANIEYKYMTDKEVFQRGNTSTKGVSSIAGTWPLVYQVIDRYVDCRNGYSMDTVRYSYANVLAHNGGRGVLGFESMTTYDLTQGTTVVQTNQLETTKYMLVPHSTKVYVGDKLVSECSKEYRFNYRTAKNTVYQYYPCVQRDQEYEYNTGKMVKHVLTHTTLDKYGNATNVFTRNLGQSGCITTEVISEFDNDLDLWYLGRLRKSTVKVGDERNSSIEVRETRYDYSPITGLLSAETFLPNDTKLGYKKTYTHDIYGNITNSVVTPFDTKLTPRVTSSTYDKRGRFIVSSTNSLGFTTKYTLDEDRGLVLTSTDPNGLVTEYTYDSFGNVIKEKTPLSTTYTTTGWVKGNDYKYFGLLYFVCTETLGQPCAWEYFDDKGRSVYTVTEHKVSVSKSSTRTEKVIVGTGYNRKGQVVAVSEPYYYLDESFWNETEYDECGRVIKKIDADGSVYSFEYDGLVTYATDPEGHTTSKEVDYYGRVVKSMDANGVSVCYEYDVAGRPICITGPKKQVRMTYDILGNRTSLLDPDISDVPVETVYNAYGEVESTTNHKGTTKYEYDKGGRMTKEVRPDMTIVQTYDVKIKGALHCTKGGGVQKTYDYDQYGRVVSVKQEDTNVKRTDVVSYKYDDKFNRLEQTIYPTGLVVKYSYTDTGMLLRVGNEDKDDAYWRLGYGSSGNFVTARGQIIDETFGNGVTNHVDYDPKNGRINYIYTSAKSSLYWKYRYSKNGCLLEREDVYRELVETFRYDDLDRLISASKNGVEYQAIEYDEAGNITYKSDVGEYIYEENSNRLKEVHSTSYKPKEWDEIQYTSFNKICKVVSGKNTLTIQYGPSKNRTSMVIMEGNKKTTHGYFDNLFEYVQDGAGCVSKNYIFANGKCVAIVEETVKSNTKSSKTYYVHHDYLGSIQAYTDEEQKVICELSYDAWGRRRNPDTWEYYDNIVDADAFNEHGFGGHEHLDLFEMINMGGRMYDPVLGRFLSPDPYVQAPDYTQNLNRYSYCLNNPLSLIDPSGYSWFSKNWKSIVASCVGIAVSVFTAGTASGIGVAIIAGALGGAASALTGALLNGANFGQIMKATLQGGLMGALSGSLNYIAGCGNFLGRLTMHSCFDAGMEAIQGGNAFHGLISGALNSLSDTYLGGLDMARGLKIASNAIIGGTVSEIGGGKFANGAITSAFSMMFNGLMHQGGPTDAEIKKIQEEYQRVADKEYSVQQFYASLGGEISENAVKYDYPNTCAARLSQAINNSGVLKIPYIKGETYRGGDGNYYFIGAEKMKNWLSRRWGSPKELKTGRIVKTGVTFQSGFARPVTGHVGVVYKGNDGGSHVNHYMKNNHPTYYWHK